MDEREWLFTLVSKNSARALTRLRTVWLFDASRSPRSERTRQHGAKTLRLLEHKIEVSGPRKHYANHPRSAFETSLNTSFT